MDGTGPGTSGGPRGSNGNRYFVLLGVVAALLVYAALQLWANVGSKLTDSEGSADPQIVWTLELTSFAAWCIVVLLLWRPQQPPASGDFRYRAWNAWDGHEPHRTTHRPFGTSTDLPQIRRL